MKMQRRLLASCLAAAAMALSLEAAADALSECYKSAENRVQVRQCLQRELDQTEREYEELVDRVADVMAETDRAAGGAQKPKGRGSRAESASASFLEANRAFDAYQKRQCAFEAAALGAGTGAGNQQIACRINLMRLRMGALESFVPLDAAAPAGK